MIYHVLNRGNGRMRIFHKAGDFDAFERVLRRDYSGIRWSYSLTALCRRIGILSFGRNR